MNRISSRIYRTEKKFKINLESGAQRREGLEGGGAQSDRQGKIVDSLIFIRTLHIS